MNSFLSLVAEDLKRRIGHDFSHTLVIFPGKRPALFLNESLAADRPIWTPRYLTIAEFFRSLSTLRVADPIETVFRLYAHYVRLTDSTLAPELFYGWGQRILSDFDDVDKNMAPASKVFGDLKELEELVDDSFLTPEQREELRRFFADFEKGKSVLRERYAALWQNLLPLYEALRSELAAEGLAYEGQLYRDVAEQLKNGTLEPPQTIRHIAFVGLNVIDRATQTLFDALKAHGEKKGWKDYVLFYWDYDDSYVQDEAHEAGLFMRRNLAQNPSALPENCFHNFCNPEPARHITIVDAPGSVAQAHHAALWLKDRQHFAAEQARKTAVVLCDETLLQPMLNTLPAQVKEVNVTKGFPLSQTPAFDLATRMVENGSSLAEIYQALQKEMIRQNEDTEEDNEENITSENTTTSETTDAGKTWLENLRCESTYRCLTAVAHLMAMEEEGNLPLGDEKMKGRLLLTVLRTLTVPFHGEPLSGLQLMGVLESRCLDFEHLILLSVNEGKLPTEEAQNSFIPRLLRKRYGLTTADLTTAVFSYYFHRLLQRCPDVEIVFDSSTSGMNRGEMSRFVRALCVESPHPISRLTLEAHPLPKHRILEEEKKPKDMKLERLSPSAINTYLRCPLSFYFHYVCKLPDTTPADAVILPQDFGTVCHKAAELFYQPLLGKPLTPTNLAPLAKDKKRLRELVEEAFHTENITAPPLAHEAVMRYLERLLAYEAGQTPAELPATNFTVCEAEKKVERNITVCVGGTEKTITLNGIIDRLDLAQIEGHNEMVWRIVDYKTGGHVEKAADVEALFQFDEEGHPHPHYTLQTCLYAYMLLGCKDAEKYVARPLMPALFFIHRAAAKDYNPYLNIAKETLRDFRSIAAEVEANLRALFEEILNPDIPFQPTLNERNCKHCNYRKLCGR